MIVFHLTPELRPGLIYSAPPKLEQARPLSSDDRNTSYKSRSLDCVRRFATESAYSARDDKGRKGMIRVEERPQGKKIARDDKKEVSVGGQLSRVIDVPWAEH
jgi:hypothetical protein